MYLAPRHCGALNDTFSYFTVEVRREGYSCYIIEALNVFLTGTLWNKDFQTPLSQA